MVKQLIFSLVILSMVSCSTNANNNVASNQSGTPAQNPKATDVVVSDEVETQTAQQMNNTFEVVEIETTHGNILVWLYEETPIHRENFLKLAREGFFDGTTFHRIIPNFMIQGGDPNSKDNDPTNDGMGGPGYTLEAEILPQFKHKFGALSAARQGDQANPQRRSSGSQFFIVQNPNGTPHLDGQYSVFGEVISGLDVVNKIAQQPRDQRDRPHVNITMQVSVKQMSAEQLQSEHNFAVPHTGK